MESIWSACVANRQVGTAINPRRARCVKRTGTLHQANPLRPCRPRYAKASTTNHPATALKATNCESSLPKRAKTVHTPHGTPIANSAKATPPEVPGLLALGGVGLRFFGLMARSGGLFKLRKSNSQTVKWL